VTTIPNGFEPSQRTGPFLDHVGPLFTRSDGEGIVIGLRVADSHLNARGRVHGAVICGLADVALGRNVAARSGLDASPVTASLQVQFVGGASLDDWLEATAVVRRVGRRVAFADGAVHAGDRLIATASAVFAMTDGGHPATATPTERSSPT
jgi:uncharacterized protein (TIGR00369 family)